MNLRRGMSLWHNGSMQSSPMPQPEGCASCESCSCKTATQAAAAAAGGLAGWRYVGWAALVFLFPLACAAGGALALRGDAGVQALGGIGGLLVGALIASMIVRWIKPQTA